jgi:hypothetical protein
MVVYAQDDPARAETLFRQARADMKALRFNEACPRFGESFALAPAPGTLLNWGICEELLGHPVRAWTKLQRFLAEAPADDVRLALAKSHLAVIEKEIGWLELTLGTDAPADGAIWVDDEQLNPDQLGTALPLLPGRHRVELRDGAHGALQSRVVVLEAAQRQALTLAPTPPPTATIAVSREPAQEPDRPRAAAVPPRQARSQSRPLRNASYASGGIALGALTASLVFGAFSLQAKSTVSKHCDQRWCDPTGFNAAQRGARFVLLADVALVVGGVAALTSASLFWADKRERIAVSLAPGGASLGYLSAF